MKNQWRHLKREWRQHVAFLIAFVIVVLLCIFVFPHLKP